MIWAMKNNQRVKATPKEYAFCPICNEEVIAKCGIIKTWHWCHKSLKDCDTWAEPESEWHLNWKNEFPKEQQEIVIGKHRADIKTTSGTIIEFQSSPISLDELERREEFYGEKLIWVLNGKTIGKNFFIRKKNCSVWKWKPTIANFSKRPIFIDLYGNGEIIIKFSKEKFGCHSFSKSQFLNLYGDIY